jgi:hypothetical protein
LIIRKLVRFFRQIAARVEQVGVNFIEATVNKWKFLERSTEADERAEKE